MIEKLQNKRAKGYFFLIILLSLVAIFCIRYFIIPYLNGDKILINVSTLNDILDKLFTSLLVTVGIATFIFWLTPENKMNAQIKILQPIEIGETIFKARTDTEKWWFTGGSGRYTRSQTLPYLASLARQKNKTIEIIIQIMNPRNILMCSKYADYRNSLRTADKNNKKTPKSVQLDLISTIVSAYMWKTEQPLLDITLGLKDSFSLFRTDLSSSSALITKEDPIEPALLYENGTFFYNAQLQDMRQSLNQVTKLDFNIKFYGLNEIDETNTKELLTRLNFADLIADDDIKQIIKQAKDNTNPYA
jgi:hypothetical protein